MSTSHNATGFTFNDATVQTTAAVNTSLVAGNGIAVSGATGAVTVSLTSLAAGSVGSYGSYSVLLPGTTYSPGSSYAGSVVGASGTWRCMTSVTSTSSNPCNPVQVNSATFLRIA